LGEKTKMIGLETIRYSLRNLAHQKGRSFLTILSILIGIATIFIFVSFGLGLYNHIGDLMKSSSADKVVVQAKGIGTPGLNTAFKLEDKDLRAVKRTAGVYDASGAIYKIAEVKFKKERKFVFVIGYDPKSSLVMDSWNMKLSDGRKLNPGETKKVTLGYNYQIKDKVFSKAVKLNDKINIQGVDMRVVGFYEPIGNPQDDSNVYLSKDAVKTIFPKENISYGMIVAKVDPNKVEWTIHNIERKLREVRNVKKGKEDFYVQSFEDLLSSYTRAMDVIVLFIFLIALISIIVSAVNTANTMITSVMERIREIGVIKAIGARNSEIFGIFLFESGFLGLIAGLLGVLLGWGLSYYGGVLLIALGWRLLTPVFPPSLFLGLILFAVLTGAVSGIIPAWKASKINTADALRWE